MYLCPFPRQPSLQGGWRSKMILSLSFQFPTSASPPCTSPVYADRKYLTLVRLKKTSSCKLLIYSITKSWKTKVKVLVAQSLPTQWTTVHPSFVMEFQASRNTEEEPSFFRGSLDLGSNPDLTLSSRFYIWATRMPNQNMRRRTDW